MLSKCSSFLTGTQSTVLPWESCPCLANAAARTARSEAALTSPFLNSSQHSHMLRHSVKVRELTTGLAWTLTACKVQLHVNTPDRPRCGFHEIKKLLATCQGRQSSQPLARPAASCLPLLPTATGPVEDADQHPQPKRSRTRQSLSAVLSHVELQSHYNRPLTKQSSFNKLTGSCRRGGSSNIPNFVRAGFVVAYFLALGIGTSFRGTA